MAGHQSFYRDLVPPGSLCFDVGANHGEKTAALLSFASKVISVEPQKELAQFIESSLREEVDRGRLIVLPSALGAAAGSAELHRASDLYQSMSTLSDVFRDISRNNGDRWDDSLTESVDVLTVDGLIGEFGVPFYIKVDVEGYDFEVLKGLTQAIELISFEYNCQAGLIDIACECVDYVDKLANYVFNIQVSRQDRFYLSEWVTSGVLKYVLRHDLIRVAPGFGDIFAKKVSPEVAVMAPVPLPG